MRSIVVLFVSVMVSIAAAQPETDGHDAWDDAWLEAPIARADKVNEGELRFLPQRPDKPVHQHRNLITITDSSLQDGWIHLQQCHHNLDSVPAAQIVYSPERIRNIRIERVEGIVRSWVDGPTVQLEGVGKGAVLCLRAESRALFREEGDRYLLRNGPYMRRFLDGYYPMFVSLQVSYPDQLTLDSVRPAPQPGLTLEQDNQRVTLETWFEGRLVTELRFSHAP